jgi:23S rRNA (uracil1939-C5)-methyltransferase
VKVQTSPQFAVGYYAFRSHDLLPIEQCPISSPLINRAIQAAWNWGRSTAAPNPVREIEFFANHADNELLLEVYCALDTPRSKARQLAESLHEMLPETEGVAVFQQVHPSSFSEPKRLVEYGTPHITYVAGSISYKVRAGSFFQVNRFLIDELVKLVTAGASGNLALDLYCGVGLFSPVLARSFAQVIAVEASQTSFANLRENTPREVKAVSATTEQFLRQASGLRPDLIVADPPRGGLGEDVVRGLARLGSPRITYVSCDPSTLARDLRTLVSLGYQVVGAHFIDLFPQTFHIESVFHLAR